MAKVRSFKMPFRTNHFNKNERVWLLYNTGALACLVTGKYRGKNRYVKAWVVYSSKGKEHPNFEEFEVDDDFAKKHGLLIFN